MRPFVSLLIVLLCGSLIGCSEDGCIGNALEDLTVEIIEGCNRAACDETCEEVTDCECDCKDCGECELERKPFPFDQRIENSAQVHVSADGLRLLAPQLPDITLEILPTIPLPAIPDKVRGVTINVCAGPFDECNVAPRLENVSLETVSGENGEPGFIRANMNLHAESVDDNAQPAPLPFHMSLCFDIPFFGCEEILTCSGGIRFKTTGNGIGTTAEIKIINEDEGAAHEGYSKIRARDVKIDQGAVANALELVGTDCADDILGINVADELIKILTAELNDAIARQLDKLSTLCQPSVAEFGCPDGSVEDSDGVCINISNGECVELLIGLEGRIDVGELLGDTGLGLQSFADFVFAVGESDVTTENGMNMNLYGGMENIELHPCVDTTNAPPFPRPEIPIVDIDTFLSVRPPDEGGVIPDNVIAVSEDFVNYAADRMWRGGGLCVTMDTSLGQFLETGLFSVVADSLTTVTFPLNKAPMSLTLQPAYPPIITFDEVLDDNQYKFLVFVDMPELTIDVNVWMTERYVRAFTFTSDMSVEVRIEVDDIGATIPEIKLIGSNSQVTNSELLAKEDPAVLGGRMQQALNLATNRVGSIIPNLTAEELFDDIGIPLSVELPKNPYRVVEKDGSRFLALFANVSEPPTSATLIAPQPSVRIIDNSVATLRLGEAPSSASAVQGVTLELGATNTAGKEAEYSYRVNGQTWSRFSSQSRVTIDDDSFELDGHHRIDVRTRIKGVNGTTSVQPARAYFTRDTTAPLFTIKETPTGVLLRAQDIISNIVEYRWLSDEGVWSRWTPLSQDSVFIEGANAQSLIHVRDEYGNIAVRAKQDANAEPESKGCSVSALNGSPHPIVWLSLFGFAAALIRRRKRI